MNRIAGGVAGAAVGTVLLGVGGYLLGLLFLAWFGPRDCCGLEGLLPVIVGTVTGGPLGFVAGAMAGVLVARRRPLHLLRLLTFLAAGTGVVGAASLVTGPVDIERIPFVVAFLTPALFVPVIVWITGVWESEG